MAPDSPASGAVKQQYASDRNLTARIRLHQRFSTNKYRWTRWVFDQFFSDQSKTILELGCGTALLWRSNAARVPANWSLFLSDFSGGMLASARAALKDAASQVRFFCCDARAIPFEDCSFDLVIANHMLYHVPDRPKALSEIRRVLRRDGSLIATTVGLKHMHELDEVTHQAFEPSLPFELGRVRMTEVALAFGLENGAEQLRPLFKNVELRPYHDTLVVTETEPMIDYVRSMRSAAGATEAQIAVLRELIDTRIRSDEAFCITNQSGLFIATNSSR